MHFLIIVILLICLNQFSFAENRTVTITCDQNVSALSNEFIKNQWIKTSMPWYASWAHDEMNGHLFIGGISTTEDRYPLDPNPHLEFINPVVVYDEERGEIIMCRYKIGNPKMMDVGDSLEMRSFTYFPEYACSVSSSTSITCIE